MEKPEKRRPLFGIGIKHFNLVKEYNKGIKDYEEYQEQAICKNCKWWEMGYHTTQYYCKVSSPGMDDGVESESKDEFGYFATGSNFGCIHWEEK